MLSYSFKFVGVDTFNIREDQLGAFFDHLANLDLPAKMEYLGHAEAPDHDAVEDLVKDLLINL